ncbi:hypothetical protein HELRODRAFT_157586 [Helobdella robusta]|uniref:Enoyl reductase (ER) domain-containing protein n=1 Tax=Helobdella robusta TaxID=6412 RepID=T1EMD5_HELRO|nr:hypothetical protein HELRODRAFT_157586 [Helobdella robusta]ESN97265.1 hypothetical protein HELRODRAFT_157586 [Helobdella robusta]
MKAIVVSAFGGPDVLKYFGNHEMLKVLGDHQIFIKVSHAGVNPVDTYKRAGNYQPSSPKPPYTPGSDGAGLVHLCGPKVTKFKPGDRVYFCDFQTGSYAEYCTVSEDRAYRLHDNLSFEQGAAIGFHTSLPTVLSLLKEKLEKAKRFLFTEPVEGSAWPAARLPSTSASKSLAQLALKKARWNGASEVLNHREDGYMELLKKGQPIDVIIEMLANVNLQKDLDLIAEEGVIVIVGSRDRAEILPRSIMMKESLVTAVSLFRCTHETWKEMGDFFDRGQRDGWVRPVIGKVYKLHEANLAHEEVIKHQAGSQGKILLSIDD